MIKYVMKRLLWMIPVVLGVAVLIFTIMYFVPGDATSTILGGNATELEVEALKESMGLNDPYLVQLGNFLSSVFLHFDFGSSYITGVKITTELWARLPRTLILGLTTTLLSLLIGIPLGITAAVNQNKWQDRACMFLALAGVSMPQFWVGLLLVIVFALHFGILPPSGVGGIQYYILPCIAGSFGGIAVQARQSRSSMLEVIRSDYVKTARAKGIPEWKVVYKHALPNALIPILTVAGSSLAHIFGGSVVLETVFSIPGIGSYMITAVGTRDYPIIRASVIFLAIVFSFMMLLVDLIYAFVDPRIKAKYTKGGGK